MSTFTVVTQNSILRIRVWHFFPWFPGSHRQPSREPQDRENRVETFKSINDKTLASLKCFNGQNAIIPVVSNAPDHPIPWNGKVESGSLASQKTTIRIKHFDDAGRAQMNLVFVSHQIIALAAAG
jgi:hypothetical protein